MPTGSFIVPHIDAVRSDQYINQFDSAQFQVINQVMQANAANVFPGAVLVVVRAGEVLLNVSWGYIDETTPVRMDSLFDLASITKIFTVTALLGLLSEQSIPLDTPLAELIPEFAEGGPRPVDGGQDPHTRAPLPVDAARQGMRVDPRRVTLRHLLTHTSGLAPWRAVYEAAGPVPAPPDEPEPVSRAERWSNALRALCGYPFVSEPDGIVRYSDLGLLLLGEVVRRLSRLELDEAIKARVLQPLGLQSPVFNPVRSGRGRDNILPTEYDANWRGRRAWGEVHDENADGVGGLAGHAGLFSTARDVAALGQAWLDDDERLAIPQVLMQAAKREQAATDEMRRGLGWQIKARVGANAGEIMSERTFGHTGFVGNSLWIDPTRRLVVTVLTNAVYYGRAFDGLFEFRRALHDTIAKVIS
jgi:CubicO group peptidase (beta-lactamase class C family)